MIAFPVPEFRGGFSFSGAARTSRTRHSGGGKDSAGGRHVGDDGHSCEDGRAVRRRADRGEVAGAVGQQRDLQGRRRRPAPEVVRAHDVPLPVRRPPHRPLVRDVRRGRPRPLHADEGIQRTASDGVRRLRAERGERRDRARHPSGQVDHGQHRKDAPAVPLDGPHLRLGPRARDLRARVLPLEPVDIPAVPEGRAGLPRLRARQLVPDRQHRAGQRAGRRRPLRALRLRGRPPRAEPVAVPRHEVRGRAAGPVQDRLAREDQRHADELDRPQRGRRHRVRHIRVRSRPDGADDLHDAHRHDLWRDVRRAGARAPAGGRADRPSAGPRSRPTSTRRAARPRSSACRPRRSRRACSPAPTRSTG